jgi:hypothetical protein
MFIELLATASPVQRTRAGGGNAPRFERGEVEAMYAARRRGLSWADINAQLVRAGISPTYKRPASLAQVVHDNARRLGIEPYITVGEKSSKRAA